MTERMNAGLSSMYSSRDSTAETIRFPDIAAVTNLFRSPSSSPMHFRVSASSLGRRLDFSDSFRPPVTILFHDDVSVMAALTLLFYRVHFASKKAACLTLSAYILEKQAAFLSKIHSRTIIVASSPLPHREATCVNSFSNYHCRIFTASS